MFRFDKSELINDIAVQKCSPRHVLWPDPKPDWWFNLSSPYRSKPLLNIVGKPLFAELAILKALQDEGWIGYWRDNWGGCFRQAFPPDRCTSLPRAAQDKFDAIVQQNNGKVAGCWDVFVWKQDRFRFFEAKWLEGRDRIRASQGAWLDAACRAGMKVEDFAVVEWTLL
jgi:hypothetical protein